MPRINHNVPAMITGGALRKAGRQVEKSLEKLSTGLRINRAADDAAGLSVSEQLRTQVRGLSMGNRNIQDGMSLLNIAEGALIEIEDMLQRIRELAIQAANDTLTSTERNYIQTEIDQLKTEIDRIANGTQYNSQKLLNGTEVWSTGGIIHVGPNDNSAGYNEDVVIVTIGGVTTGSMQIDGAQAQVISQTDATNAISQLDLALYSVNTLRADLGAQFNRLEHALNNQESQEQNMQAAESVIRDADFALETTKFTRNQILQQSSTAMLSQANMVPQNVLSLLQG
ncbi:MAG: flagellin [Chitinivibrionales bacterium]|nr:flagellin [Chitinivibrionales bacterium]MBD3357464.1 flagellin [Chitinivibrionales bacterium]